MKRLLMAALLLVVLGSTYLVLLPATWVDALLQRASRGSLAMTGATGSFWRGEGSLQALLPGGAAVTLTPVRWQVAAAELLALKLHFRAESARDGKPVLDATLTPGGTRIDEVNLELPASLLGVLSPTLREADFSGQILLQVKQVRVARGEAGGSAKAYWKSAGSGLSRIRPLGNYLLDLDGKGDALDFRLSTMGGPLTLAGSGKWRPGKPPEMLVTATPEAGVRQDLAPLLRLLGRDTGQGSYRLTFDQSVGVVTP